MSTKNVRKVTKASRMRELFKDLSETELLSRKKLQSVLKQQRLAVADSDIYRIRNEFLNGKPKSKPAATVGLGGWRPTAAGSTGGASVIAQLLVVKEAAEKVGGLPTLKHLAGVIERLRDGK